MPKRTFSSSYAFGTEGDIADSSSASSTNMEEPTPKKQRGGFLTIFSGFLSSKRPIPESKRSAAPLALMNGSGNATPVANHVVGTSHGQTSSSPPPDFNEEEATGDTRENAIMVSDTDSESGDARRNGNGEARNESWILDSEAGPSRSSRHAAADNQPTRLVGHSRKYGPPIRPQLEVEPSIRSYEFLDSAPSYLLSPPSTPASSFDRIARTPHFTLLRQGIVMTKTTRRSRGRVGGGGISETLKNAQRYQSGKIFPSSRAREDEFKSGDGTDPTSSRARFERLLAKSNVRIPWQKEKPAQYDPAKSKRTAKYHDPKPSERIDLTLELLKLDLAKAEEKVREELLRSKPVPKVPSELAPEESAIVQAAFKNAAFKQTVGTAQVDAKSLQRLKPGTWLDDEIINFYGSLMQKRSDAGEDGMPRIHYFNSFFYGKMAEKGYNKLLARWTKKTDIFAKDNVVFPINLGNAHWTAANIDIKNKRVEYYDSMGTSNDSHMARKVFDIARDYLEAEHQDKKGKPLDTSEWTLRTDEDAPQQDNGNDCGVFSCQTLEAVARGVDVCSHNWEFGSGDMPFIRRMMVWEIAKGKLYKRW